MTTLCPSPHNQLGKGVFSPDKEAKLLADGYIFACRIVSGRIKGIVCCKRPIADAMRDMELDDPYATRQFAAPTRLTPAPVAP